MNSKETLLVGKVLQLRDKLMAKRHQIPQRLQDEWHTLTEQTACFDPNCLYSHAVKGQTEAKPALFSGDTKELEALVSELQTLNSEVIHAQWRH
ncbi:hypothetical protein [Alteromonas sp. CYL-A6]|uniref:hypothetical protein n=1 Tax=Alteromonas nitratireducens TaxID=3390813 RepID=UPI0034BEF3A8